jgi:hypothetical protein
MPAPAANPQRTPSGPVVWFEHSSFTETLATPGNTSEWIDFTIDEEGLSALCAHQAVLTCFWKQTFFSVAQNGIVGAHNLSSHGNEAVAIDSRWLDLVKTRHVADLATKIDALLAKNLASLFCDTIAAIDAVSAFAKSMSCTLFERARIDFARETGDSSDQAREALGRLWYQISGQSLLHYYNNGFAKRPKMPPLSLDLKDYVRLHAHLSALKPIDSASLSQLLNYSSISQRMHTLVTMLHGDLYDGERDRNSFTPIMWETFCKKTSTVDNPVAFLVEVSRLPKIDYHRILSTARQINVDVRLVYYTMLDAYFRLEQALAKLVFSMELWGMFPTEVFEIRYKQCIAEDWDFGMKKLPRMFSLGAVVRDRICVGAMEGAFHRLLLRCGRAQRYYVEMFENQSSVMPTSPEVTLEKFNLYGNVRMADGACVVAMRTRCARETMSFCTSLAIASAFFLFRNTTNPLRTHYREVAKELLLKCDFGGALDIVLVNSFAVGDDEPAGADPEPTPASANEAINKKKSKKGKRARRRGREERGEAAAPEAAAPEAEPEAAPEVAPEPAPDVAPEPEAEAETAKRQVPSVEDELCAVCLDLEREYAMIPCGHRCLCRGCFDQILGTEAPRCPMCNTFLQGAGGLRVYG